MICLCFSDSHGTNHYIKRALMKHPDAEVVFFLGDGLSDIEALAAGDIGRRTWIYVRGNCDTCGIVNGNLVKKTEQITLHEKRIILTHGDLFGAKLGYDGLIRLAEEREADAVLFGHTHLPYEKYVTLNEGGVYLFNPGSIGQGRGGGSYGVIDVSDSGLSFSHLAFM